MIKDFSFLRTLIYCALISTLFSLSETFTHSERDALLDLYTATNGPYWRNNTNWGFGDPCINEWHGIQCEDGKTGRTISLLNLARNSLDGTLPESFTSLKTLRYVDLSFNSLYGTLPSSIGSLSSLFSLSVAGNMDINGSIPPSIWNISSLVILDLSFNSLSGEIPHGITPGSPLQVLRLDKNELSGSIPYSIALLDNLQSIDLGDNNFTGSIPVSIGMMNNLKSISLSHNRLEGVLPTSVAGLNRLQVLNIEYNRISGTIPENLYSMDTLQVIQLTGNLLSGTISEDISKMRNLEQINLSLNELQGEIPSLAGLVKLKIIDFSTCKLSGTIPDISSLVNLQFIDLSANSLYGSLPEEPPRLPRLRDLDFSSNHIEGTLPSWVSNVTFSVYLVNNPLDCPYPSNLPQNIHVNENCVSGWWYEGLFSVVVCIAVVVGFLITCGAVSLSIYYGLHPSLLTVLTEDDGKELDVDKLHKHSQNLTRMKTILLLLIVGVSLLVEDSEWFSPIFLFSIPPVAIVFFVKAALMILGTIRNHQKILLLLTLTQVMQLVFIPWSFQLTSPSSATNQLSLFMIILIFFDSKSNIVAATCSCYIHEQFIPVHLLKLDDKLGNAEGVFGEVRHGKYLGTDIAAKRAKPETKRERKKIFREFLREAHLLSVLGNHPNIIHLLGISPILKDEFYIVTEYCEDRDALTYLRKVQKMETFNIWIRSVLRLCIGVCDAMAYIHKSGYTHRDITISNIFVKGGRAKLGDFGLARRATDNEITVAGSACIPVCHSIYAPPELKRKDFPVSYSLSCDVYCFGIAIWEMLMVRKWSREDTRRARRDVLQDLAEFPLYFVNIVSRCWHETDSLRPTFAELHTEFIDIYSEEWSNYRSISSGVSSESASHDYVFFDEID